MTKMDRQAEDREALERLLDIYGADRTRWREYDATTRAVYQLEQGRAIDEPEMPVAALVT